MCNCREREHLNVDVRRLNVDAETKMRLGRYKRVDILKHEGGVTVDADGIRVTAPDGIDALKTLAAIDAELGEA